MVGWSPEGEDEIMTLEEMTDKFSFERVSKSAGVFDIQKLNWMNNQYLKQADNKRLTDLAMPHLIEAGYLDENGVEGHFEWVCRIVDLVKEKLDYMAQIVDHMPMFVDHDIEIKEASALEMIHLDHVASLIDALCEAFEMADDFEAQTVKGLFKNVQKETGIKGKNLFMCSRIAITGQEHGPDLMETISILGKDIVIGRMKKIKNKYCR